MIFTDFREPFNQPDFVRVEKHDYQLGLSKTGTYVILYEGYSYGLRRTAKYPMRYWRCCSASSRMNCKGRAIMMENGVLWVKNVHCHEPKTTIRVFP